MQMKKKILALVLLICLIAGYFGYRTYAAATATLVNGSGTPFTVFTVLTNADTTIAVPSNDVLIMHTGIQNDGSTASASTDYIVVMNAFTGDGTTGVTMAASYAAGSKLVITPGAGFTLRGADCSFGTTDASNEIIIRAVGHGATVQIVKGSQFGSRQ